MLYYISYYISYLNGHILVLPNTHPPKFELVWIFILYYYIVRFRRPNCELNEPKSKIFMVTPIIIKIVSLKILLKV
jgi:hypothetical protein